MCVPSYNEDRQIDSTVSNSAYLNEGVLQKNKKVALMKIKLFVTGCCEIFMDLLLKAKFIFNARSKRTKISPCQ